MFRSSSPVYHRCPACTLGYRQRHLRAHMELNHPQPTFGLTLWDRFAAWVLALFRR